MGSERDEAMADPATVRDAHEQLCLESAAAILSRRRAGRQAGTRPRRPRRGQPADIDVAIRVLLAESGSDPA
jgi:hypothetical protein